MSDKIALITGGSRGLGRNAALKLAEKGVDVIITWRQDKREAEAVVAAIQACGRRAAALQLDVADVQRFGDFVARLQETLQNGWRQSRIDYLLNNAGVGLYGAFAETTEAQFDTLMLTHFKGPFFLTQRLLPLINDGGRILNVSSGLARFSQPGYAAYASMKGAMEVLTRYQARELGARGITVNILAPGAIETDFGGGSVRDNPEINAWIASQTALGRAGLPDDIGYAVAALFSDETRWITAQRIEASGGMFL